MIYARRAIEEMSTAVCEQLRKMERPGSELADLKRLEASVIAKLLIAEHNAALLSNASLEQLSRLDNPLVESSETITLVSDADWDITIKSRKAGTLLRLMAFSGVVSACVNATDTLGRYLRKAYGINNLEECGASLKAVRDKLSPTSSIRAVLEQSPGLDWMEHLRNLRGECQHGKLAGTLYLSSGANIEPVVPRLYCESDDEVPISAYIEWALARTAELITKLARAIAADPVTAVQLKN